MRSISEPKQSQDDIAPTSVMRYVMSSDIRELLTKIRTFRDERDWAQFHTLKNLTAALSVEAAELLEITQWKDSVELERSLADSKLKDSLSEEVADVFIYLLLICDKLGIDPYDVAERKITKNKERYPIEKARGTAKKYSEL